MKKELLTLSLLISTGFAFSQVGINTTEPKATFDVNAKETNATTAEGIIAPRLSGDEITEKDAKYSSDQTGTLIYATSAATVPSTKTINITAAGYYYFDGSKWNRFTNASAKNGLVSDADFVQLGGALTKQTTINTDATNNLVINATGIGNINVEENQGLNVLATAINSSTAKAIAVRGRVFQGTGSIGQARGVSGAANITGGTVNGTATGAYFNTAISGTTLPNNGIMTGVAADAETIGANTNSDSNTFAGARFGANVTSAPTTHSAGVVATAVGSSASNVGIAASTTTDAGVLTGKLNALPVGTNVANYSYAPDGTSNYAIYSDGKVAMQNLPTGIASNSLLVIDATGVVKTTNRASLTAGAGSDNVAIGTGAGNPLSTGERNIFIGANAGAVNTAGKRNTGIGANSLVANTTGAENSGFGYRTLTYNTTGSQNTAIGGYAMLSNTSGTYNTAIGSNALYENKTGDNNTALGWRALGGASGGSSNIGVGYNTGINVGGSNNIIIGNKLDIQSNTASNQLNIGNIIYGTGVDGTGVNLSSGNVGIGVKNPTAKLEINGKIKATNVNFSGLPTYADETAAIAGGLNAGDMYKTVGGDLKIKL